MLYKNEFAGKRPSGRLKKEYVKARNANLIQAIKLRTIRIRVNAVVLRGAMFEGFAQDEPIQ